MCELPSSLVSVVGTVKVNTWLGVKGDLLLTLFPRIDIRLCRTYSVFNFPLSFSSPLYLLLPFNFLLLLPACPLFVLFNLVFFLTMGTYCYEFTVACDRRPGNPGVTSIRSEALCS